MAINQKLTDVIEDRMVKVCREGAMDGGHGSESSRVQDNRSTIASYIRRDYVGSSI